MPTSFRCSRRGTTTRLDLFLRLDDYYTPEEVRHWLYAPHPQLEGERAIDFIVNDQAADVIAILDRLDADAYL